MRISSLAAAGLIITQAALLGCTTPTTGTEPVSSAPSASEIAPAPSPVAEPPKDTPPNATMDRAKIPDQYKWKLEPLFASDAAFEATLVAVGHDRTRLLAFKGTLSKPTQLLQCLDLYFQTRLTSNKLSLYGSLRHDSYQKDTQTQSVNEKALQAINALMDASSFIKLEILAMNDKTVENAFKKAPELEKYKPYIAEIRRRKDHVLGAEAERVLSLAEDNLWAEIDLNELPSDHEKAFKGLLADIPLPKIMDEKNEQVQLTLASYGKYRGSSDRRVRGEAVDALFSTLAQYKNAFAGALSGQVRRNVFLARSRGYDTALAAYLHKDNIDTAVYHNLVSTIRDNLAPLHRYIALRKKVMGVDELRISDLYTPMVAAVPMEFTYEEAQDILPKALSPLGEDYVKVLRLGLDPANGWIDVYPHMDKGSGAFSASVFGVHPFVKMNYFGELDDLSTLAHEYGHALHSHLSMTYQPYVTSSYTMFTAEIASTFNEKLLSDYLLANAKSDDERLYLLNELVERIRTTIYRQTLFAEFELLIHTAAEGGTPLTADFLEQSYAKLIKDYFGEQFSMGKHDGMEWAYIPHFYYKYYVFSYATGLSSGIALA
ncbi:MAG: oligoendopeptidase F family protein, partial [Polyangiaceae bacterium]|nr:oligoendopeptidase F family protein [Polyangiaceae bacterium]